jgi:hypothetical protein
VSVASLVSSFSAAEALRFTSTVKEVTEKVENIKVCSGYALAPYGVYSD